MKTTSTGVFAALVATVLLVAGAWFVVRNGPVRSDSTDVLALTGRVIDGTGSAPIEDGVLVLGGGRIQCVAERGSCPVPRGATVIDVRPGTIMPGLIDLHVHARPTYAGLFLAAGVTTVRDANNTLETTARLDSAARFRPRVVWAGPMIVGDGAGPAAWPDARRVAQGQLGTSMPLVIGGAEDGIAAVDSLAARGAGVIKLYHGLSAELLASLVARARHHGLPVMADIGVQLTGGLAEPGADALDAIAAGVTSIEHLSGFALAYRRLGGDPAGASLDSTLIDRLARAVIDGETFLVPTLISSLQFSRVTPASLEGVPMADRLDDEFLAEWHARHDGLPPAARRRALSDLRLARALVSRVISLGGTDRIAVGTDSPNPYVTPGGSVFQELELLVDAGLSPVEAIRAATGTAARVLGRDDLGVLAPGRIADIIVVGGDPTADIRAARDVRMVIQDGRPIPADVLLGAPRQPVVDLVE